ncbi:MAG: TylF/MycF/NovP-related O-methyltransferase [Pirellulales bacterium]
MQASANPVLEFFSRRQQTTAAPDGYDGALKSLGEIGVQLTLPPSRIVALLKCWQMACSAPGDVIECGSYRGVTALLIALISKWQGRHQKIFVLDTFSGSPPNSKYDSLRPKREYVLPPDYVATLKRQAASIGVEDRVEIHRGEFIETFKSLEKRPLQLSFAHIDANLYRSTLDACEFVIPRMSTHGFVVFDDYHGPCDLGARLAIDRYLDESKRRPLRLAGSSAFLQF